MNIVVATCKKNGIGINNTLPWRIIGDTLFFKYLTIGNEKNAVVMGKNTFLSLPKPLPHRDNLVLSRSLKIKKKNIQVLDKIRSVHSSLFKYENVYLIGGEQVYFDNIKKPFIKSIYHTKLNDCYDCDTFFPEIPNNFNKINSLSFNDVDTKNKKDVSFDIDVYLNTEYNGDAALNSEQLKKELDITLHKLKVHHNIVTIK